MSLYDRLVPAEALRFDRTHPMTRLWPELYLWTRANPAIGERIVPEAIWEMATDPDMPPGVVEIDGHRYPLIEFTEESPQYATGGFIPKGQPITLTRADFPLIRPTSPRLSWLPWRKRR